MLSIGLLIGVAVLMGFRPTADPVEWVAAIGLLALVTVALTWLSAGAGLAAKSVEAASNVPTPLVLLPAGAAAAWVGGRLGPRAPLAIGLGVAAAGASLLAVSHATVWQVAVFYLVVGLGSGLALAALPRLLGGLVPATQTATVNGINTVARTVGGALGAQVAIAIVAARAGVGGVAPARSAFSAAFWLAAAVAAAGTMVARSITSRVGDRGRPGAGD